MNSQQKIFEFNVIDAWRYSNSLPTKTELMKCSSNIPRYSIMEWFDDYLLKLSKQKDFSSVFDKINCWIGITSESIDGNLFADSKMRDSTKCKKFIALITTDTWERSFSPPSLFEYLTVTTFKYALTSVVSISGIIWEEHSKLTTNACIYDSVMWKLSRRFSISSPNICRNCQIRIDQIDHLVNEKYGDRFTLNKDILKIISKEWLGNITQRNTPIFNLKRDYKYDIDRNSGLYKNFFERFKDNVSENLSSWVIGTLITGVVGGILILAGLK